MASHPVPKGGIVYIIPTDELFEKYRRDEAYIDKYGRLMNRKPHRVLKELEHYAAGKLMVQKKEPNPPIVASVRSPSMRESFREVIEEKGKEYLGYFIDWGIDKTVNEGLPAIRDRVIIPLYHTLRAAMTPTELKVDAVRSQAKTKAPVVMKPQPTVKMTKNEADAEKRKALYHWLGLLDSLAKLQNAGELDTASTLAQLTDPAMLGQVNRYLGENPNLLETDKYLLLHHLLGRDLYEKGQLLPIGADEIKRVAASHGFATEFEKMEDKFNG